MTKTDFVYLDGIIDEANAIIAGVSVITIGEAKGHDLMIDDQTLREVQAAAETYSGGLKVKTDHYTGFDNIVGTLKNFIIDGDQLRADLHLLKNHDATPRILEMAELMPDTFGLSISFSGEHLEKARGSVFARCSEIYSADLVDAPAANPSGLFSAMVDSGTKNMDDKQISEAIVSAIEPVIKDMAALSQKLATLQEHYDKDKLSEENEDKMSEEDKEKMSEEDKEKMAEDDKEKDDMMAELTAVRNLLANFGAKPLPATVASSPVAAQAPVPTDFATALALVKSEGLSGTAATKAVIARFPEIYLAARNVGIRNL